MKLICQEARCARFFFSSVFVPLFPVTFVTWEMQIQGLLLGHLGPLLALPIWRYSSHYVIHCYPGPLTLEVCWYFFRPGRSLRSVPPHQSHPAPGRLLRHPLLIPVHEPVTFGPCLWPGHDCDGWGSLEGKRLRWHCRCNYGKATWKPPLQSYPETTNQWSRRSKSAEVAQLQAQT